MPAPTQISVVRNQTCYKTSTHRVQTNSQGYTSPTKGEDEILVCQLPGKIGYESPVTGKQLWQGTENKGPDCPTVPRQPKTSDKSQGTYITTADKTSPLSSPNALGKTRPL